MNFTSLKLAAAAGLTTLLLAGQALAVPVFSSSDTIWGGQSDGTSFTIGMPRSGAVGNNWPGGESPEKAIDGAGQKYLNFAKENSGLVITAGSSFVVDSMKLWAANDFTNRDPASFALYGTNAALSGSAGDSFDMTAFNLIAGGSLALPDTRNGGGSSALLDAASQTVSFLNTVAYSSYMLLFPTLKDSRPAIAVQIAEVQLYGESPSPVPVPAAGLLLLGGLFAFGFARRRA
jgi:hypothetical protein